MLGVWGSELKTVGTGESRFYCLPPGVGGEWAGKGLQETALRGWSGTRQFRRKIRASGQGPARLPRRAGCGGMRRRSVLEARDAGTDWEPGVLLRLPRGQQRTVTGVKVNAFSIQKKESARGELSPPFFSFSESGGGPGLFRTTSLPTGRPSWSSQGVPNLASAGGEGGTPLVHRLAKVVTRPLSSFTPLDWGEHGVSCPNPRSSLLGLTSSSGALGPSVAWLHFSSSDCRLWNGLNKCPSSKN